MNDEQIFARAVQLSGDERIQFIAQSCGQDPVQRDRMEKLLAAHETPDSMLAVDGISSTTAFVNDDSVGEQIGPYKLLQKLGEGGMGAVYLAERQHPVKQRVALKIIKHGMDSKKFIARFEAERQALAMMDHPNIASVHDAGCTQSGRPYLVMELVKGVPITTFCDQNKLSTRERLELFIPVCHAVQHAHQKGIIHRDLKPSNILVAMYDDRPVPKVIDFGLAKAANQQLTDKTLFTEVGSILGTWEYMSPEQAVLNQLDVDTRTDVYALGVILYELLTGVTPLDRKQLREVQLRETLRIIQEVDPPIPSTRVSGLGIAVSAVATYRSTDAAGLSKAIRGDLDWVTMKALEKDRRRRYEAASRLADDVAHVLAGEAVEARPPSFAYTMSKLWNRHKLPISTAALILCSLVIASIVTSSLWLQGRRLRKDLEVNNERLDAAGKNEQVLRIEAESAKDDLLKTNDKLQTQNYSSGVESAFRSLELGNLNRVAEFLRETKRGASLGRDLRGFEWRLLKHQYDEHFPERTFHFDAPVIDVRFAPSGRYLVALLADGHLIPLNLESEHSSPQRTQTGLILSGNGRGRNYIDFFDDNRFLVGGGTESAQGGNRGLIIEFRMDADTKSLTPVLKHRVASNVHSLHIEDSGRVLVGHKQSEDGTNNTYRLLLDSSTLDPDFAIPGVGASIWDGKVATHNTGDTSRPQEFRISDLESGEALQVFTTGTQPKGLEFTEDKTEFFSTDSSGVWSQLVDEGELGEKRRRLSWRRCTDLQAIPGRPWLALAGSDDNSIRIIDIETKEQVARRLHEKRIYKLDVSRDGKWLASCGKDQTLKIWNVSSFEEVLGTGYAAWFAPLAVASRGGFIAHQGTPHSIHFKDLSSGRTKLSQMPKAVETVNRFRSISLSEDGGLMVVGGEKDAPVQLWNTQKQELVELPIVGRYGAISPKAEWLLLGDSDSYFRVSLVNGKPMDAEQIFTHDGEKFSEFAFSRDESLFAFGGNYSKFARVWNASNTTFKEFPSPTGAQSVAFSPDNKLIAIAGRDDRILVYNLETGELAHKLLGNGHWLTSARFSVDGRTLAAASPVGEIKFWSMPTGEQSGSLTMEEGLRRIEFGADGNTLFWSSMDGDVGCLHASPVADLGIAE